MYIENATRIHIASFQHVFQDTYSIFSLCHSHTFGARQQIRMQSSHLRMRAIVLVLYQRICISALETSKHIRRRNTKRWRWLFVVGAATLLWTFPLRPVSPTPLANSRLDDGQKSIKENKTAKTKLQWKWGHIWFIHGVTDAGHLSGHSDCCKTVYLSYSNRWSHRSMHRDSISSVTHI